MVLSNFLSRQNHDDSNLHKVIPVSFNMHNLLHEKIIIWEGQRGILYKCDHRQDPVE